ncbi:calcium-binding protein [Streptomyces sp. N50]|uniref:calcium-binding protein n=1 Tax=Streptomyces sp. N50 TaxID=3081765 RepID=UPI00296255D4|nr:calcium-binding protein [Streptomyces sp. N50]WOX11629.1 calcium-binding protein [Streptomyces sp. N50]
MSAPRSPRISRRTLRAASALSLAVGAGLAVTVALPATAGAVTTSTSASVTTDSAGRRIQYTAAPGQTNKVTVTVTSGDRVHRTYVIDDVVPITIESGTPCTRPDSADLTRISCTGERTDSVLAMSLADGDDTVTYTNATGQNGTTGQVDLGSGNDRSTDTTTSGFHEVYGGPGDDTITGVGTMWVQGGDGKDTIHVGAHSHAMGENGVDTIYADGDGAMADGGRGNDFLYGGPGGQLLQGGTDGNDTIRGGTGNDQLYGQTGNDILYGNSGNDTIYGNSGNDQLYGGPGTDTLSGGPGRNVVHQN